MPSVTVDPFGTFLMLDAPSGPLRFHAIWLRDNAHDAKAMADRSLISLQLKLIKMGPRNVRHARAITFLLAEVTGEIRRAILAAIQRLRAPPSPA